MYAYTAWVAQTKLTLADGLPYIAAVFVGCVLLAALLLRFYDVPVRRWLTKAWADDRPAYENAARRN